MKQRRVVAEQTLNQGTALWLDGIFTCFTRCNSNPFNWRVIAGQLEENNRTSALLARSTPRADDGKGNLCLLSPISRAFG